MGILEDHVGILNATFSFVFLLFQCIKLIGIFFLVVLVFASMRKQIDSRSVFAVAFQAEGCSCASDSS